MLGSAQMHSKDSSDFTMTSISHDHRVSSDTDIGSSALPPCQERSIGLAPADWSGLIAAQQLAQNWQELLLADATQAMQTHPRRSAILAAITESRSRFQHLARMTGLPQLYDSSVHVSGDLDVQAFALMLGTTDPEDMVNKGVMTYGTHLLDDELDPSAKVENRVLFRFHRADVRRFFDRWGTLGEFGHALSAFTHDPAGYYRGIQRVLYGSLFAHASAALQMEYFQEYQDFVCQPLSPELSTAVRQLRPACLSFTSKTATELFPLEGEEGNLNASEIRSIAFAPALLLVNLTNELRAGELNYYGPAVTEDELIRMVRLSAHLAPSYSANHPLFADQVAFVAASFRSTLTPALREAYAHLENVLRRTNA